MIWSVLQGAAGAQPEADRIGRRPEGWAGQNWLVKIESDIGFRLCEKCGIHTMNAILGPLGYTRVSNMLPAPKCSVFVCRNPFARMVSVWWGVVHVEWRANKDRVEAIGSDDFPAFVRWITQPDLGETRSIFQTQTGWLGETAITDIVHLENLAAELEPLLGPVEVPRLNEAASVRKPWTSYYDDATRDRVRDWAAADFERFGYERVW